MHLVEPVEAKALPAGVRRMLRHNSDGDWSRVVADDSGGYTVYNNATQALRAVLAATEAPTAAPQVVAAPPFPAPPKARPVAPPVLKPSRREPTPEAKALNQMFGSQSPTFTQAPAVKVVEAPKVEKPDPYAWSASTEEMEEVDWGAIQLDSALGKLRDGLAHGLPDNIPFRYLPDVLAMQGMDFNLVETTLRMPQRVEIRPESAKKHYPILSFHRGDIVAILGLREPTAPMIIAAYAASRLDPDIGRAQNSSTGGGGRRREGGLPGTVPTMIRSLRGYGVVVDPDPSQAATEVTYKGQKLGKISTGPSSRQTIESDYQRTIRRVQAIDARAVAAGG